MIKKWKKKTNEKYFDAWILKTICQTFKNIELLKVADGPYHTENMYHPKKVSYKDHYHTETSPLICSAS